MKGIESSPPAWYQAVEATLVGTGVVYFCIGESVPGNARVFEVEVEDVINVVFLIDLLLRGWANGFEFQWLIKGPTVIDLLSCLPILDIALPSAELPLGLSVLRFVRAVRLIKATARVAGQDGREQMSVVLSVVKVLVTVVGTLSIAATLLWRVEGGNGLNPELKTLRDAYYYMLNIFAQQGAPFQVVSPEGQFVTALAMVTGLVTIPLEVAELISALRRVDASEQDRSITDSNFQAGATSLNGGLPVALPFVSAAPSVPSADKLGKLNPDFFGISVSDFCAQEAGLDPGSLAQHVLDADPADVFTLLEDPAAAAYVTPNLGARLRLAAALVRRKRGFAEGKSTQDESKHATQWLA